MYCEHDNKYLGSIKGRLSGICFSIKTCIKSLIYLCYLQNDSEFDPGSVQVQMKYPHKLCPPFYDVTERMFHLINIIKLFRVRQLRNCRCSVLSIEVHR